MRLEQDFWIKLAIVVSPVIAAVLRLRWPGAVVLALAGPFSIWMLTMKRMSSRRDSDLVLVSIPPSHFVEKVRWAMDRLKVNYREEADHGLLGVTLLGRPVPALHIRKGKCQLY